MFDFWQHITHIFTYYENRPIIFTEFSFWVFFSILLFGYSFIYQKHFLRTIYLLLFSFFFYYKSSGLFFVLLIFATICDYTAGILIASSNKKWARKLFVGISVSINLGVLSYFKYAYFFTNSINSIFGTHFEVVNYLSLWTNQLLGSHFDSSTIILPVGISFYTFQTISYTVDIYRRKLEPLKNILDFAFYVSFFPQLVAGPIVRAAEFVPQIYRKFALSWAEFSHAYFLILNGLIKKMLISDYISINFVDRVFDNPLSYSGFENLTATYGYALQIYCDFSGYTDIAIGVALLLGFRLPINFNSPYKAVNITDFWHRWHISLSSWLRDYLYIPLGGNRKGKIRSYINLMITMLLGGLWHGANIRFMIWGGIHGVSLAIHKVWTSIFPSNKTKKLHWKKFVAGFITFQIVCLSWIFFRSAEMSKVKDMFGQIYYHFGAESIFSAIFNQPIIYGLIALGFTTHWLPTSFKESYRGIFIKSSLVFKIVATLIIIFVIFQFKASEIQPFIYFRF